MRVREPSVGEEGEAKAVAVVATAIKCTIKSAVWL